LHVVRQLDDYIVDVYNVPKIYWILIPKRYMRTNDMKFELEYVNLPTSSKLLSRLLRE